MSFAERRITGDTAEAVFRSLVKQCGVTIKPNGVENLKREEREEAQQNSNRDPAAWATQHAPDYVLTDPDRKLTEFPKCYVECKNSTSKNPTHAGGIAMACYVECMRLYATGRPVILVMYLSSKDVEKMNDAGMGLPSQTDPNRKILFYTPIENVVLRRGQTGHWIDPSMGCAGSGDTLANVDFWKSNFKLFKPFLPIAPRPDWE